MREKMSNYTYEKGTRGTALEKYEWDNVWWESTNEIDAKRVLYIGDSISCGTRRIATEVAGGELLFDGFGTSKAVDNPYLNDAVSIFARQQGKRCAVIFNNGLHGWHLDDEVKYPYYYEQTVKFLLEEFKDTPLALVLTTSVADGEREIRVKSRNIAVMQIAEKYGLPIIDLYSASVENAHLRKDDGVHFSAEGYKKFAELIVGELKKIK